MDTKDSYLLKPLRRLTLRQAMLVIIPALSTLCWIILLLIIYQQFARIGLDRYVQAQERLIDSFIAANMTSLKLHDNAELQRNMASLEFGSDDSITAIIGRDGEYLLDSLDTAGRDFAVINDWISTNDRKEPLMGERFARGESSYFVFQTPISDPDDAGYLGTLISFVDDSAFRRQEAATRQMLIAAGVLLLIIQMGAVFIIINKIVAPIEEIARKASRHKDLSELSEDLAATPGAYTKDVANLSKSLAATMARHAVDISLGRLTSQLAHDMRSPLSTLKMYANTDVRTAADDEDWPAYQESAARSVKRLNDMADELLSYSRSRTIERRDTDIAASIRGVLSDAKILVADRTITFSYEGPDSLICAVDEPKLERVLTNLMTNAIQAISAEGAISVAASLDARRNLTIRLSDNGMGIKAEHLPHIFDQTFTFGKKGGLGLGLAYCNNVVRAHGGNIEAASREGKGSEFVIAIPSC